MVDTDGRKRGAAPVTIEDPPSQTGQGPDAMIGRRAEYEARA